MTYLRYRLLRVIPVFFLVTFASFALLNILPGDAADAILAGADGATDNPGEMEEAYAALREEMGLDRPIYIRYFSWLGQLAQGDFGESYVQVLPVSELLLERMPVTIELLLLAQTIALLIAIPAGIYSALHADKPVDRAIGSVSFAVIAMPPFLLAILLVFLFAIIWRVLPSSGWIPFEEDPLLNLQYYLLPSIVIGVLEAPVLLRVLRVDLIATLQEDYIAFAKAKGLSTAYILFHHALRPSSFTLVTVLGLQFGFLISGTVIIEQIFSLPGMGKLVLEAIDNRDAMVLQGAVTVIAIAYVGLNFIVDILYAVLDPRVSNMRRAGS